MGELHLALWLLTAGHHVAAWRHPLSRPQALLTLDHYVEAARLAERATFDMVFFEDALAARERTGGVFAEAPFHSLDPMVQIAALAGATSHIGLAASASTTYHDAATLAARFATIDALSGGRAAWNMVTSGNAAARNFGAGGHPEHATRYAGAEETVRAVGALWEAGGPTSPQGRPVLIQAGMSSWGLDFAAAHGEAIFSAFSSLDQGRAFRDDMRARVVAKGRPADAVKVLPGFMPIVGSTDKEARDKTEYYRDLIGPRMTRALLSERFNFDFMTGSLDRPFPMEAILPTLEDRPMIGGGRARFVADVRPGETIAAYAARMVARPTGHLCHVGTPESVADFMQAWRDGGGCDGFILQALQIPLEFALFVEEVAPILRRRGLLRQAYAGTTLREHLGLARPA